MAGVSQALFLMAPVLILTLLQFSNGKAIRFVVFFSFLPGLLSVIFWIDPGGSTARDFLDEGLRGFIIPTLVPLATLILATTALGNEIEDRTMVYLIVKPVSRLRIVVEKYAAVVQASAAALWLGLVATWLIAARGDAGDSVDILVAAAIAALLGVMAYGAVFLAVSLIVPRALIVGIIYILIWESFLSRFIPGTWVFSIRHYVGSVYIRILDDPSIELENALQLYTALPLLLLVAAAGLLVGTLRLRTMDFE